MTHEKFNIQLQHALHEATRRLRVAESALEKLIFSMRPHPIEHPAMFKAREQGIQALKQIREKE